MDKSARVSIPKAEIERFCKKWHVRELALFGSVLKDGFRPDSDIDVIVDFEPGKRHSLFDLATMTDELKEIFGREVDLMTRQAVQQSRNYIRRKAILSSMKSVYVS
jgi:predicted nucleotidyltransferase